MSYDVYREIEKQLADEEELKPPLDASENGAFSPDVDDDKAALTLINDAIQSAGHDGKIKIAIDMNASNFCKEGSFEHAITREYFANKFKKISISSKDYTTWSTRTTRTQIQTIIWRLTR